MLTKYITLFLALSKYTYVPKAFLVLLKLDMLWPEKELQ